MKKLKLGIIGCGYIANNRHIPSLLKIKNVDISAICDVNNQQLISTAKKFNVKNYYSNLSDMIKNENLDIIDICVPPKFHAPVAIEAAENGCHVLLEKPMAINESECNAMIEAAKRNNVQLSVIHNEIYYPVLRKAEKLIARGKIGKLVGFRWIRLTPRKEYSSISDHWIHELPGGILGETGPHGVYTALRFIGMVKKVNLMVRKKSDYPWLLFDDYRVNLDGEKALGSLFISHATDRYMAVIDIIGTEGILTVDLYKMLVTLSNSKSLEKVGIGYDSIINIKQRINQLTMNTINSILGTTMISHELAINDFINSIQNEVEPLVTAEEGRETVRVVNLLVDDFRRISG